MANWYRWLTDHITYDHEALEAGHHNYEGLSATQRDKMHNQSRSSFHTLWTGKGVCTGIRNIFNFGCELMNVEALPANCRATEREGVKDTATTIADHAVSMLSVQSDGKVQHLLCDPTWDLGKPESRHFMCTFEEAEDRGHQFTVESDGTKASDAELTTSLQPFLRQQGLLRTRQSSKESDKRAG